MPLFSPRSHIPKLTLWQKRIRAVRHAIHHQCSHGSSLWTAIFIGLAAATLLVSIAVLMCLPSIARFHSPHVAFAASVFGGMVLFLGLVPPRGMPLDEAGYARLEGLLKEHMEWLPVVAAWVRDNADLDTRHLREIARARKWCLRHAWLVRQRQRLGTGQGIEWGMARLRAARRHVATWWQTPPERPSDPDRARGLLGGKVGAEIDNQALAQSTPPGKAPACAPRL